MGPLDALWHLLNFVFPAIGVAVVATALAKLAWRGELAAVRWSRLLIWSSVAGAVALLVGLFVFGRDGKMGTYAALVVSSATALWWVGFVRR